MNATPFSRACVTAALLVVAACADVPGPRTSERSRPLGQPFLSGPGVHEPAGYVRLAEHSFAALPEAGPPGTCTGGGVVDGCWFTFDPDALVSLVSDGNAPASPPGVLQVRYPIGLPAGESPALFQGWDGPGETRNTEFREIYESSWIRVPTADFEMQQVGVKFLGYIGVARNGSDGVPNQIYFGSDNPTGVQGPFSAVNIVLFQQAVADRRMDQNVVTGPVFTFGSWHHLEYQMVLNDIGLANGTVRIWWDGSPIMSYDDVRWRDAANPSGFYARRWDPVWGGGGGGPKTRDDFVQIDDVYLSGVACDPLLGCM